MTMNPSLSSKQADYRHNSKNKAWQDIGTRGYNLLTDLAVPPGQSCGRRREAHSEKLKRDVEPYPGSAPAGLPSALAAER